MTIVERLTGFVRRIFKTNLEVFYEALRLSPSAQGYVHGSISELLLKQLLESKLSFEVKRIREKWEGKKHPRHHGDFYIRQLAATNWFVLESKGVKSNSEKWHKLYNLKDLKTFLYANSDKINWIDPSKAVEPQVDAWIDNNLPRFKQDFQDVLYDYEEIQKYAATRDTPKSRAMTKLKLLDRDEVARRIRERLNYVRTRLRVLETHFPVGKSGSSARTQATPRKDEFNIVSVDIHLRYSEHKFLFANPQNLTSSNSDANHLQQNYVIGFVFVDDNGNESLSLDSEWSEDFLQVFSALKPENAVAEADMQIDTRAVIVDLDESEADVESE